METTKRRIALYSHDGMGIGHVRRNLLIAQAISHAMPDSSILLIAGVYEAGAFKMPPNIDCLTLPSLKKSSAGSYEPRRLVCTEDRIFQMRSSAIHAAVECFDPHVMIVDKVPRGVAHELDETLAGLRRKPAVKCVLGLRDILDEPSGVRREWMREGNEQAIQNFYDAIWVYGDRSAYDASAEYGWSSSTTAKIAYTGYLERCGDRIADDSPQAAEIRSNLHLPPGKINLCLVGGGEDGAPLAEAFTAAEIPDGSIGVVLAGPFMPADARQRLHLAAEQNPRLKVLDFLADPSPLIRLADRAVAMGGYNCVGELLCAGTPSLIVPRVAPRHEQLIRAQRFAEMGLIEMLHPDRLSAQALTDWMSRPHKLSASRGRLDFDGLTRIPKLLRELIAQPKVDVRITVPASAASLRPATPASVPSVLA